MCMGGTQDVYGCGARMCTGAARKCIWGGGGVAGGSATPTDPLQSVPLLPPPAGSDGGELGQGPIHIDPAPHIHGPHCARRPTVRDGWPTLLIPSFTFTSLSDPVLILWCPSQPSADGMRRGAGPQDHALPQSRPPPGGAKIPASTHPCRVPTTRPWGCFREVSHQGPVPWSHLSCDLKGPEWGPWATVPLPRTG